MKTHYYFKGVSMIELMIVLAIVGIITAIALPSYQNYIIQSRRGDMETQLLQLQLQQESYRLQNTSYATAAQLGSPTSEHYDITVGDVTATTFTITAKAKSSSGQAKDTGCTEITIDQSVTKTPADCW